MRVRKFSEYEEKAATLSGVQDCYRYDTRRKETRKIQLDESQVNERIPFSGQENFRTNVYYSILDTLSVQLAGRKSAYEKLYEHFNFFDNLSEIDINELKNLANRLVGKFSDVLEETLGNDNSFTLSTQRFFSTYTLHKIYAMYYIHVVFEIFTQMSLLCVFF